MIASHQLMLLRAALGGDGDATRAWARWKQEVGLDRAEIASQRLLPLVYRNLRRLGVDDPELPRLKGLYRHAWSRNQLLFRRAGDVLREFREAGVETLVLKGVALSALHYRDAGVRPMDDFDVLVRPGQAAEAVAIVRRTGWTPAEPVPAFLEVKHAHPFSDAQGKRLDLHWNALWEAAPDDDLWERAVPFEVHGEPTRALGATDQLLHVCVHGAQWDPTPSIRWVADAVTVLADGPIDWDGLLDRARDRRITLGLAASLRFLRDEFGAAVPDRIVGALDDAPHPAFERLGHRAKSWRGGLARRFVLNWDRYRRLAVLYPEYSRIGFVGFSQQFAGLDHPGQLPRAAFGYAATHWRRRLTGRSA